MCLMLSYVDSCSGEYFPCVPLKVLSPLEVDFIGVCKKQIGEVTNLKLLFT
jgi:hypothetical protein